MGRTTLVVILVTAILLFVVFQVVAATAHPYGILKPHESATTTEMKPSPSPTPDEKDEPSPTPSPTPTPDVELEKAKRDAELAEERKKKEEHERDSAKAQRDAAKARLGLGDEDAKPAATPPSGNVTGDTGNLIETQILAGAAAREASVKLATQICKAGLPVTKLIINNGMNGTSVQNYRSVVAQVSALHDAYQEYITDARNAFDLPEDPDKASKAIPPALIAPAVSQTVKSVADVINLFRTETNFKNVTITAVNDEMMVTLLADALLSTASRKAGCSIGGIYYPSNYSPNITVSAKSPLLQAFIQLRADQAQGDAEVAKNKAKAEELTKVLKDLDAQLAELEKQVTANSDLRDKLNFERVKRALIAVKIERLKLSVSNLEAFKTSTASIINMFSEVNNTTKQTLLTEFLQAERLATILDESGAYVLDLTVTAAGMLRIRRNLFFNAKTAHTGGVTVSVRLYDNGGLMVFGRVQEFYIDFTDPKTIRRTLGFQKLEQVPQ
jgi:hypothetical protein